MLPFVYEIIWFWPHNMAEKCVGIVTNLLIKTVEIRNDTNLALLSYRPSPLACGYSPAELLVERKLRKRFPDYWTALMYVMVVVVVLLMQISN